MALKPITVSQLNDYMDRLLGTDPILSNVIVKGEISGINYHSTGHIYFSIVDSNSKINCFLPRDYAEKLRFKLDNGMDITVIGRVNIFKKMGTYSIYIKNVEVSGEGNLSIAFEKLKKQLETEGLFDPSHKKPIPEFPRKIGIVTSKTGAAVRDILKIIQSKNNFVNITVFPVLVQGTNAAPSIAKMIDFINENYKDIDTLIVGRGGGSAEDLWAFNEEILARSVFNSSIPIISGVGHEIDFTICDFVADLRAETPTAAANLAVPNIKELRNKLSNLQNDLHTQLSNKFMYNRLRIDVLFKDINGTILDQLEQRANAIEKFKVLLEENNPFTILNNGYSIIENSKGQLVTDADTVNESENYKIVFGKGEGIYKLIKIGCDNDGKK